jgi:methyl-accepting chemotaxis protein
MAALQPKLQDPMFERSRRLFVQLGSDFDALQREVASKSLAAAEGFARHGRLVEQYLFALEAVADESALSLDPVADSYFLMTVVTDHAPRLIELVAQARGRGAGQAALLAEGKPVLPQERATIEALAAQVASLRKRVESQAGKALTGQGEAAKAATAALGKATTETDRFLARLNSEVLAVGAKGAAGSEAIFQAGSAAVAAQRELLAVIERDLHGKLEDRVQGDRRQRNWTAGLIALSLALAAGLGLALVRSINRPLARAVSAAQAVAQGRLDSDVADSGSDEPARLLAALGSMQANLTERNARDQQALFENGRVLQALDTSSTNIMLADADYNIIYGNRSLLRLLQEQEHEIRKDLPRFDAKRILGSNIDQFHKNPAHQRGMLAKLSGTHVAKLTLGARRFDLVISPVLVEGQRTGTIVEWTDRTEELAQLERELALGREGRRVQQALDATTSNVMIADAGGHIVFMNKSLHTMMQRNEARDRQQDHPRGARRGRPAQLGLGRSRRPRRACRTRPASRPPAWRRPPPRCRRSAPAVKQNADSATVTDGIATQAARQALDGGQAVAQTVDAMKHRHQDRHHRRHRLPDQPAGAERRHRGRPRRRTRQGLRRGGRRGAQAGRAQPGGGAGDRQPGRQQRGPGRACRPPAAAPWCPASRRPASWCRRSPPPAASRATAWARSPAP